DGRYIGFASEASNLVSGDTNGFWDIFVHDRQTGKTIRVSLAADGTEANNQNQDGLAISADGNYVAFVTPASNLVTGDTNTFSDVFVRKVSFPPPPPTTLIVNSTDDIDDDVCDDTHCSLREAINDANDYPDANTITFNIPGGGVHTIQP